MKYKMKFTNLLLFLIFLLNCLSKCADNAHFYRGSYFFKEPRFDKDYLTSINFSLAGGKTTKGFNFMGQKTNILQIYGFENISQLAKGVPKDILDISPDSILNNIWQKKCDSLFGKIRFFGKFKILEFYTDLQYNFRDGFFMELNIPIRKLQINNICLDDISNSNDLEWLNFIDSFAYNMKKYNIYLSPFNHTGIGDVSILAGWTNNYEDTRYIDFIDTTIKFGILLPTGKSKNPDFVFSLPMGYNKHFGFPISCNFALGLYEWATIGIYAGVLPFVNKTKNVRVKTAKSQNGFIKLTKIVADVHEGTIWNIGAFFKFDHIINAFSLTIGYRFDKQESAKIFPKNCNTLINTDIINSDKMLFGWQMNTINIVLDYDFATYEHPSFPHIAFIANIPFRGKQIFKTQIFGLEFTIDHEW